MAIEFLSLGSFFDELFRFTKEILNSTKKTQQSAEL